MSNFAERDHVLERQISFFFVSKTLRTEGLMHNCAVSNRSGFSVISPLVFLAMRKISSNLLCLLLP